MIETSISIAYFIVTYIVLPFVLVFGSCYFAYLIGKYLRSLLEVLHD